MGSHEQRIGIFGGTFDPPHLGHLIIAEHARAQLCLDRVYFIPASTPPHKRKSSSAKPKQRLQMTKLAVRGNKSFKVSEFEIKRGGVSYTINTVREFRRRFPHAQLFLIIGLDNLSDFRKWKSYGEILRIVELIVYPRSGRKFRKSKASRGYNVHLLRGMLINLSSSEIRKAVRSKSSIRYLVPSAVKSYIKSKKLYR